mmetsp:Transcript_7764/g.11032  ORF Transcript_7764/g.11032 Transcript_7764/m.11032 type:complete len:153 (+) Transcript_7764:97-555(+)
MASPLDVRHRLLEKLKHLMEVQPGQRFHVVALDVQKAFRQLGVRKQDWMFCGLGKGRQWSVMPVLDMGSRASAGRWGQSGWSLKEGTNRRLGSAIMAHVDDHFDVIEAATADDVLSFRCTTRRWCTCHWCGGLTSGGSLARSWDPSCRCCGT